MTVFAQTSLIRIAFFGHRDLFVTLLSLCYDRDGRRTHERFVLLYDSSGQHLFFRSARAEEQRVMDDMYELLKNYKTLVPVFCHLDG